MPSLPVIGAYRIDIQQGNVITQDMVDKLKPGMTRSQVRFVLGTPLVTDVFHQDRWDYVYRYEKGGKLVENRHIVAVFKDDKLLHIEGDVVASSKPVASSAPAAPASPTASTAPGTAPAAGTAAPAPADANAAAPAANSATGAKPAAAPSGPTAASPAPEAQPANATPGASVTTPEKK